MSCLGKAAALIELFPLGGSRSLCWAPCFSSSPPHGLGAGLDAVRAFTESWGEQWDTLGAGSRVCVEGFVTATHAGQAAVQVGEVHVCNRHGRAKELPKQRTISAGKESKGGCCRESWVKLPRSLCRHGLGGREGGTHVQQRAGVHAEAVRGQHGLQVIQVGVDGVQVVVELVPGPKREECRRSEPLPGLRGLFPPYELSRSAGPWLPVLCRSSSLGLTAAVASPAPTPSSALCLGHREDSSSPGVLSTAQTKETR